MAAKEIDLTGIDNVNEYYTNHYLRRIVKLSATPLRNRPHMVFCSQGTS